MPGMDGTELLAEILRRNSRAIVILMTAFGSIEAAVEAIKFGATDYVSKPFQMQDVLFRVARALKEKNLEKRVADLENEIRQQSAAPLNFTRTIFALCAHARQDACAPRINIKKFYKQSLRRHKKWQQQHKI